MSRNNIFLVMLENERIFTVKRDNVKFEREMKTTQPFRRPAESVSKKEAAVALIISPQLMDSLLECHLTKWPWTWPIDFQLTVSGLCLHNNGDFT